MRKDEWTLEYSTEQNCFHIDLLERTLKTNLEASLEKRNNDYQIVFIGSEEECRELYYKLKKEMD